MHVVSFLVRSGKYSCRLVPLERFSDHQRIAQSTLAGSINVSCLPTSLGHTVPSTSCIPYKHFIFKVHGILLKGLGIQEVQRVMKKYSDLVWEYCLWLGESPWTSGQKSFQTTILSHPGPNRRLLRRKWPFGIKITQASSCLLAELFFRPLLYWASPCKHQTRWGWIRA